MSNNTEHPKTASRLISSAILGEDFKVVIVAGERYVIHPPTIERLAGAAYHLAQLEDEDLTTATLIQAPQKIEAAARALSWFVSGNEKQWQRIAKGAPEEVASALIEAYSLVDVTPFMRLSALAKSVSALTARSKQ